MNDIFSFKYALNKDRYEGIKRFRETFFNDPNVDAHECPFLTPEVAESWNRSRALDVNYREIDIKKILSPDEYDRIVDDSRDLVDVVRPLFESFKELEIFQGNALYLFHVTGAILLLYSEKVYVQMPKNYIWDESTIGTGPQSLCMMLKRPVQLVSVEWYCNAYADLDMICTASPVIDQNGSVLGCVVLRQDILNSPWDKNFQSICIHTLGLIYAMAISVENELKLKKSYDDLKTTNNDLQVVKNRLESSYEALKATWSLIKEAGVVIDKEGKMLFFNKEAQRVLNIDTHERQNKYLTDFFKQSRMLNYVKRARNIDIEETIHTGNDERKFLVSIRPILNPNDKQPSSAVLRFMPIEKFDAFSTKRSGSLATYVFEDIIGQSRNFKLALNIARNFARSQENILLSGESGTGKELFAQAIHNSNRRQGPFVALNCASIPRNLIESELMGYEAGSFTGAERSGRPGKIELADNGTLFLDEIGDMPFDLQSALLRVLENKKIMRIGGRLYKNVDFKLIAATNKDLSEMVKHGIFREDLYYRLSVLTIKIPALREREDDLELLSHHFVSIYCKKEGKPILKLVPDVINILEKYKWPGNVRQLENAIIYAVNVASGGFIKPVNLPDYIKDEVFDDKKDSESKKKGSPLKDYEKELVETILIKSKYNVAVASRMLNISKPTMYRKLKKYEIDY